MIFVIVILPLLFACSHGDRGAVSTMSGAHKSSERLVGGSRCTWGPSYWCHQVKNARECSAVHHCVQSVWTKQQEPQDTSAVCKWCDDFMDDIRDLVAANTSKNGMRGYIKDGCRRIPPGPQRAACADMISADINEIRQMLKANVPDRTICKTINFCAVDPLVSAPQNEEVSPVNPQPDMAARNYCKDCHNFFNDAKEIYLGNYTEDEFKQMLIDQCDQAGYPAITELCKTVIEQYWPQIYARLQMFFDPDEVCYQLNFCNTSSKMNAKWTLPLVPLTVARARNAAKAPMQLPLDRMLINMDFSAARTSPKKVAYKNDVECVVCEFVMSYLDRMLENNYTQDAIQSALDRVCNVMPKSVRDSCQGFVDQYSPAIMVILGNLADPAMVCQGLNLCQQKKEVAVCGGGKASCETCTIVFQSIKTLLEDYEENVRIAALIKSYCAFFPGEAKQQCETAVITYLPYAMQMLAQLLSPEAVCRAVKMCSVV